MQQLYDKPVWSLMQEMVQDLGIKKGDILTRDQIIEWFADRYPKVKDGTIQPHLVKLSINAPSRVHYNAKSDGKFDLFFRLDPDHYRLYDAASDPAPIYKDKPTPPPNGDDEKTSEFAYERDLRNFLVKNLTTIESGLSLFEDEGITGIEFPVGGRFIDILAVDKDNSYVVIELKVSRGYDRTVGQLLRYMNWIEKHQAEPGQAVRGIIVAKEISEDLLLACARMKDVDLYEYELSVAVKRVEPLS